MKPKNHISEELNSISPGIEICPDMANFSMPEGYFATFHNRLQLKIAAFNNIHTIPNNYFKSFPDRVLNRIRAEHSKELEDINYESPLLTSLKNKRTLSVPKGYFENLSANLTNQKSTAIVRPMFSKRFIWKQVAAAVITGVIAVNALWNFNETRENSKSQISENSGLASSINQSKQFKSEDQIIAGIAQLSGDDIAKYLAFNSSESDIENVISNINENDLPVQDPSLIDDKAISIYLNN